MFISNLMRRARCSAWAVFGSVANWQWRWMKEVLRERMVGSWNAAVSSALGMRLENLPSREELDRMREEQERRESL